MGKKLYDMNSNLPTRRRRSCPKPLNEGSDRIRNRNPSAQAAIQRAGLGAGKGGNMDSLVRLVRVPALITLGVTLLRLIGELQGWSPALFSRQAGGGGALVGIDRK